MEVFCNPARRPRFAVHGKSTIPNSKTEAGCTRWCKAERQKTRPDPILYKNISKFVHSSDWENGFTKKDKKYLNCKYKHHSIRIYGEEKSRY